jgi:carbon storage regulator
MLVLSRKLSQQILIASDITITVVKIEGNHVRLGIEAPPGISILREELVGRQKPNEAHPAGRQGVHTC